MSEAKNLKEIVAPLPTLNLNLLLLLLLLLPPLPPLIGLSLMLVRGREGVFDSHSDYMLLQRGTSSVPSSRLQIMTRMDLSLELKLKNYLFDLVYPHKTWQRFGKLPFQRVPFQPISFRNLADHDRDMKLNVDEYVIAMYLISARLMGKELPG